MDRILIEHAAERAEYPFDEIQLRQMIAAARRHVYAYNDIHVFKGMETITDMAAVSVPIRSGVQARPSPPCISTAITQRLAQPRRDNIVAAVAARGRGDRAAPTAPSSMHMEPRAQAASSALPCP